jgi:iron complex outermembrane recepter protein
MKMKSKGPISKAALLAGVAISVLAATGQTKAQDATILNPVVVEGEGAGGGDASATGPVKGYAAKASTTGSKSDMALRDIPQSVSVVGREELSDRGVVGKVDEALRYTPGVFAEPFGADPDTDWIYVRGFDASQTGLFLDGLNLFSYSFGNFQIDPFFLERIEVLKGPSSVLYGASNPGGLVNMVSKRPLDEPLYYTEIGINSDGNAFAGFDVNDTFQDEAFTYRVTGKLAGGDQSTKYSEDLRGGLLPQLTWSPDEATKLNVYAFYTAMDQVHVGNGFYPYVGTVVDANFGRIDPDAFYGEPSNDDGEYQQFMLGHEFEHSFDNGWTFSQNGRYGHLSKYEALTYIYGYEGFLEAPAGPDARFNRFNSEGDTKVDTFALDNRVNGTFETGGFEHDLTVGLDLKYFRLDHVQAFSGATPIDVIDPIYGVPQPPTGVYLDQVLTQRQVGVYLQDQVRFGDGFIATLNGRYDWVRTESDAVVGYSYAASDSAASGRAGLAYEFANGLTPYVSASTFFTPIVAGSATAPIKPEEGYQVEGGFKYEPTNFDGMITASVFHLVKQNWTVTGPAPTFIQSQIGEVTSTGIELEGKMQLTADWKATAAFTYMDLEITNHEDRSLIGNSPYLVPAVTASVWLDYTIPEGALEGVSLAGGLRYQGKSWADYANTKEVPDVVLADAALRYEKNGWGAALNVTNLFDKEYVKGCQTTMVCGYGDGRTFTLKLSKTW